MQTKKEWEWQSIKPKKKGEIKKKPQSKEHLLRIITWIILIGLCLTFWRWAIITLF